MGDSATSRPVFPCEALPEDPGAARLLGLYPQRQEGLWMQRLKVLGGRLTPEQWDALAAVAGELTPGTPLHLTTRQDIELHNLSPERVAPAQARLAEAGLTGLGACGDTLRNVTVCPCSGLIDGAVDLEPMARIIRETLEGLDCVFSLPRKFKIDLSCGSGRCGRPWINDLGLIATRRDGRVGFRVIGAGSLGAKPGTGMPLLGWIAPADVPALVVAAVGLFNVEGDRENRRRARLRHVRERLGDEAFAALLTQRFEEARAEAPPAEIDLPASPGGFNDRVELTFIDGDVTSDIAGTLATMARRRDVRVRIAAGHRVIVFGRIPSVRSAVQDLPALRAAAESQPTVIACPGTHWCAGAIIDTRSIAGRLREVLPPGATACISGCPNGCAHSTVAPIGLTGRRVSQGDGKVDAYDLYAGGEMGLSPKLAECVGQRLLADEVVAAISKL